MHKSQPFMQGDTVVIPLSADYSGSSGALLALNLWDLGLTGTAPSRWRPWVSIDTKQLFREAVDVWRDRLGV
jgi:hypothetical protein